MTPTQAKQHIKALGLTGVQFAETVSNRKHELQHIVFMAIFLLGTALFGECDIYPQHSFIVKMTDSDFLMILFCILVYIMTIFLLKTIIKVMSLKIGIMSLSLFSFIIFSFVYAQVELLANNERDSMMLIYKQELNKSKKPSCKVIGFNKGLINFSDLHMYNIDANNSEINLIEYKIYNQGVSVFLDERKALRYLKYSADANNTIAKKIYAKHIRLTKNYSEQTVLTLMKYDSNCNVVKYLYDNGKKERADKLAKKFDCKSVYAQYNRDS